LELSEKLVVALADLNRYMLDRRHLNVDKETTDGLIIVKIYKKNLQILLVKFMRLLDRFLMSKTEFHLSNSDLEIIGEEDQSLCGLVQLLLLLDHEDRLDVGHLLLQVDQLFGVARTGVDFMNQFSVRDLREKLPKSLMCNYKYFLLWRRGALVISSASGTEDPSSNPARV
jgi:hypothetical protein